VELVQWLRRTRTACEAPKQAFNQAARNGHLDVVRLLQARRRERRCGPWTRYDGGRCGALRGAICRAAHYALLQQWYRKKRVMTAGGDCAMCYEGTHSYDSLDDCKLYEECQS
jgi:uncharacterized protein YciI